jgi:hypothetical protein
MSASETKPAAPPERGSVREGICLGLLMHLGIQAFYAFAFVRRLHMEPADAIHLLMMLGGVTQLPYMVPAIVDARVMRRRDLTARGLSVVALGVMCLSLWALLF